MKLITHPGKIKHYTQQYKLGDILNEAMMAAGVLCEYQSNEIILEAGEPLNYYYLFLEGKLKIYQRQTNGRNLLLQFYTKPDSLGDVELIQGLMVTCTVATVMPSLLFRVEVEVMKKYAETYPPFLKYMINSLSEKLLHASENYALNLLNPVKNRIASYVLGHRIEGEELLLTDSLQDISEFIGTTYRQLHRAFEQLEEEGVLSRRGKQVTIKNLAMMEHLAGEIYHIL